MAATALTVTLESVLAADEQLRRHGEQLRGLAADLAARVRDVETAVWTRERVRVEQRQGGVSAGKEGARAG